MFFVLDQGFVNHLFLCCILRKMKGTEMTLQYFLSCIATSLAINIYFDGDLSHLIWVNDLEYFMTQSFMFHSFAFWKSGLCL